MDRELALVLYKALALVADALAERRRTGPRDALVDAGYRACRMVSTALDKRFDITAARAPSAF